MRILKETQDRESENPYAAPTSPSRDAATARPGGGSLQSLLETARDVFLQWEKLRIAYVGVLAGVTLLCAGLPLYWDGNLLITVAIGAVFANVAYFLGPCVDTYIRWLGYSRDWPRWLMFVCGTILALLLALAAISAHMLPDQT